MPAVVHKFRLPCLFKDSGEFEIEMPTHARILSLGVQHGYLCIWALVDTDEKVKYKHQLQICGTGQVIEQPASLEYVGTFMLDDGNLVFHLFRKKPV